MRMAELPRVGLDALAAQKYVGVGAFARIAFLAVELETETSMVFALEVDGSARFGGWGPARRRTDVEEPSCSHPQIMRRILLRVSAPTTHVIVHLDLLGLISPCSI